MNATLPPPRPAACRKRVARRLPTQGDAVASLWLLVVFLSALCSGWFYPERSDVAQTRDAAASCRVSFHEGHATDINETIGAATTTLHRVFDELGRLTSFTDSHGYTIGYTYDSESNVQTVVYPGGKTVTYSYDGSNRLKTVVDWTGRTTTYTYDEIGRLQTVARPNNTRQRVTFDNANRLSASYEELMSGSTVVSTLWQAGYGFDNANHLTSFTPSPIAKTKAPPAVALTYDSDNQLATYNGQTVGHDSDGNLLNAPVQGTLAGTLVWDVRKRLVSAGGVTYAYDSENRRIASTTGGQTTTYVYSPGAKLDRLLAKINPDGSVTRYVYGAGLLYEETTSSGGTAQSPVYYHFDWRGDTVALSDASGTVTARLSYSPFGERTVESGTVSTPFGFNGQWGVMTESNGLLVMQARFYSPVLKRFLSEDPSGFAGGTNLYAFAGADPVDFLDPFGLGPVDSLFLIGWNGAVQGLYAALDGANPMGNPFANAGLYDTNDPDLQISKSIGTYVVAPAAVVATGGAILEASPALYVSTATFTNSAAVVALGGGVVAAEIEVIEKRAMWVGEDGYLAAKNSGAKLLDITDEAAEMAYRGNPSLLNAESKAFAEGAIGDVPVYLGNGAGRAFWNYELPALIKNMNSGTVNSIDITF